MRDAPRAYDTNDARVDVLANCATCATRVTEELSGWFIPPSTPAPKQPAQAAYYIAPGTTAWGAQDHDDVVYVGDMSRELDVFKLADPNLLLKLKVKVKPLKLR